MAKISGKQLKRLRVEANLTQEQLGKKLGMSRETIGAIETDKKACDALQLKTLKMWFDACRNKASADAKKSFIDHIKSFLNW